MITLTQAFRLCNIQDCEVVYLRRGRRHNSYEVPITGRTVREKYDMKHERVVEIGPRFCFGTYEGLMFTLQDREESRS